MLPTKRRNVSEGYPRGFQPRNRHHRFTRPNEVVETPNAWTLDPDNHRIQLVFSGFQSRPSGRTQLHSDHDAKIPTRWLASREHDDCSWRITLVSFAIVWWRHSHSAYDVKTKKAPGRSQPARGLDSGGRPLTVHTYCLQYRQGDFLSTLPALPLAFLPGLPPVQATCHQSLFYSL